jgi:hypothetical protein
LYSINENTRLKTGKKPYKVESSSCNMYYTSMEIGYIIHTFYVTALSMQSGGNPPKTAQNQQFSHQVI